MSSIKPRSLFGGNEKLRSISVFSSVSHRKPSSAIMFQLEIFIGESLSINTATCESQIYYQTIQKRKKTLFIYFTSPPVPSPLVKSPPWIMKSLMTLWNLLPLYPSPWGFWASSMKFLAVIGTVLPKTPISTRPAGSPPMVMSNHTYLMKKKNSVDKMDRRPEYWRKVIGLLMEV